MSGAAFTLRRRSLLTGAAACAIAPLLVTHKARAKVISETDLFPVVETAQGRLRGLDSGGIKVFKGIRYGADTTLANRWRAPQPVQPWAGVRDASAYGPYAPQLPIDRRAAYANLITYDLLAGGMSEDCLVLNLWTPTLTANAKKPVLVHLHGGGYYGGSGNAPQFDGEMLARFGDAVFINLNHRLGSFGFLQLDELAGADYASSGNVGMQDIVAALAWVRDNVAAFGGDPSRVLVFGQSGGGAKTSCLMAMPSAKGLFHRAGVMSGSVLRVGSVEAARVGAANWLRPLGLTAKTPQLMDRLQKLPFQQLLAAQIALEEEDRARGEAPRSFVPVVDGEVLPRQPFDPDAPPVSADVPMIVGSVLDERAYRMGNFDLDAAGLERFAQSRLGPKWAERLRLYREDDPKATPFVLQARIDTDLTFRRAWWAQAERKARQGAAPVYSYLWKAPSPAFGGRYGAVHGVDVGPSLHDIRHGLNGPTPHNLALAGQIASAWVAFAASGNPNNPRTPAWPAMSVAKRETLVFEGEGGVSAMQLDPRGVFRGLGGI
jgi:para-nitrobenzyl esterase